MSLRSVPGSDLGSDGDKAKNLSISELISTLRTAYRTKDFDRVEEILVAREAKLKKEIENEKKQYSSLLEQYEVGKLDRICLEDVVNEQKSKIEELKTMKEDLEVSRERERKAEERYEKLLEEVKKSKEEKLMVSEIRRKNCEVECARVRAEGEVELWKKRFEELNIRVSKLEEDLMDLEPPVALDCDGNTTKEAGAGLNLDDSPIKENVDLQAADVGRVASGAIIDIIDSDDDCAPRMLKRKRDSCLNASKNINDGDHEKEEEDISKASRRKMEPKKEPIDDHEWQDPVTLRRCEEKMGIGQISRNLMHDFVLQGVSDDSSSSSDSDDDVDDFLNLDQFIPKVQRNNDNQKWEFEADMLAEFKIDSELCMKAVCALYRQQTSVKRSPLGLSLSNNRGFSKCDTLRGSTLAEFLIDGDPQRKLRKSVTELEKYDQKGLSDCKRLAIAHSKQLFEIYQKKEDPFFLS
uniref:Uncharacterized protein n=1 Tax=Fagus sylvatica TaxID=28930 RepID=A0A2N9FY80_FAGSY